MSRETGLVAMLAAPERVEFAQFPVPDPGPGEVILEVVRANICGSDLHFVRGGHPAVRPGFTLGHEGVGRVRALGSGVVADSRGEAVREGDLVTATYFMTCGHCGPCGRGHVNLCANATRGYAAPAEQPPHFHGTFATHWHIGRQQSFFKVPSGLQARAAASANCALSQMVHAAELADIGPGSTVLIQGSGGLGLCGAAVASIRGARVVMADTVAERLGPAPSFGAAHCLDFSNVSAQERGDAVAELGGRKGIDVVVEVTGVPSALGEALDFVRPGGTVVTVGNISPGVAVPVDPGWFTRSGVTVKGCARYASRHLGLALDILEQHKSVPWDTLVDAEYPLQNLQDALSDSFARKVTRASVIPTDAST